MEQKDLHRDVYCISRLRLRDVPPPPALAMEEFSHFSALNLKKFLVAYMAFIPRLVH